jgi:hypothetical protein
MISWELPKIVCLCGSTRFKDQYMKANLEETLMGNIVLSVGWFTHSDTTLHPSNPQKISLDELHKRKIDLCNEVLIINPFCHICPKCNFISTDDRSDCRLLCPTCLLQLRRDQYIGKSTADEIDYAIKNNKKIRWVNKPSDNVICILQKYSSDTCKYITELSQAES